MDGMYQGKVKKDTPHPEERPLGRVSKDELIVQPSFETLAKSALFRMRVGSRGWAGFQPGGTA
jgi:hypothetical protein